MPILMVAHNSINSLNFLASDLSEEREPLDFSMSKFKSSSPTKHPMYIQQQQFYGSNSDMSSNRDEKDEEPGKHCRAIVKLFTSNTFSLFGDTNSDKTIA